VLPKTLNRKFALHMGGVDFILPVANPNPLVLLLRSIRVVSRILALQNGDEQLVGFEVNEEIDGSSREP
jgi:hypothetical protein